MASSIVPSLAASAISAVGGGEVAPAWPEDVERRILGDRDAEPRRPGRFAPIAKVRIEDLDAS